MGQHPNAVRGLKVFDLLVMVSCFTVATILVAPGVDVATLREFFQLRVSLGNFLLFGIFVAMWHLLYSAVGLYEDPLHWKSDRKPIEVLKATSIGTCAIVALAVPFQISFIDARFVLVFWASVSVTTYFGRLIVRDLLLHRDRKQANHRRVLVVGANERSVAVAKRLEADPHLSCRVVGFIDDTDGHAPSLCDAGYQLVAKYDELADYLGRAVIDEVLVCLPIKSRSDDIKEVVSICEEQGIAVGILRDLFQLNLTNSDIRQVGEQTIFMVRPHAIKDADAVLKRSLDILISAGLIIVLSPVFLAAALLVKLTSQGPVSFEQERVGLNKKPFRMIQIPNDGGWRRATAGRPGASERSGRPRVQNTERPKDNDDRQVPSEI